jgi:hypothetical protein
MFQMSYHSTVRAEQRSLTIEEIEYVIQFGKRYFCKGALVYYLRARDLPAADRHHDQWTDLNGTAVVLSPDWRRVITVWRNRKEGQKWLRKRSARLDRAWPVEPEPILPR